VDGWFETARQVLFETVVHRQVVLTVPKDIRPLTCLSADRFRMVRSYGIYARTVRNRVHALVADALAGLQPVAQQARDWVGRRGAARREAAVLVKSASGAEDFGDLTVHCARCGTEMILVRVWSAISGVLYDLWAEDCAAAVGMAGGAVARKPKNRRWSAN